MSETNQVMCSHDRARTEGSLSGTAGYCFRKDTFYFSSVPQQDNQHSRA